MSREQYCKWFLLARIKYLAFVSRSLTCRSSHGVSESSLVHFSAPGQVSGSRLCLAASRDQWHQTLLFSNKGEIASLRTTRNVFQHSLCLGSIYFSSVRFHLRYFEQNILFGIIFSRTWYVWLRSQIECWLLVRNYLEYSLWQISLQAILKENYLYFLISVLCVLASPEERAPDPWEMFCSVRRHHWVQRCI